MNLATEISRDLWAVVKRSYDAQAWSNAILDGVYHLSDSIRSRTGLQSDGVALAGQALGGKSPKLRLNKMQSESEQNIQLGAEQLLRGLYQAIRNPRSHDRIEDTQRDADSILIFVDYLLRLLGHAQTSFSLTGAVARVLDDKFVPVDRYALLLVEEIPQRERLQVGLQVFKMHEEGKEDQVVLFLKSLLSALSQEAKSEFIDVLSSELRDNSNDNTLRLVLRILSPDDWSHLNEVSRLRSENRILIDFKDGRAESDPDIYLGGDLACWSTRFWPHFTFKDQFLRATTDMLDSRFAEVRQFIYKVALPNLRFLTETPTMGLRRAIISRLKAVDTEVYIFLKLETVWPLASWPKPVMDALAKYEELHPDDAIIF